MGSTDIIGTPKLDHQVLQKLSTEVTKIMICSFEFKSL
jgi:hypothetical protein